MFATGFLILVFVGFVSLCFAENGYDADGAKWRYPRLCKLLGISALIGCALVVLSLARLLWMLLP